MKSAVTSPFECIDPSVGDELWRLEAPQLDDGLRVVLEAHLATCHACAFASRVDAHAAELGRAGRLRSLSRATHGGAGRRRTRGVWLSGLALAASLAAVFSVPPRPTSSAPPVRGAGAVRFLRPVEGEVLATGRPVLRWTPVAGATRYGIDLRDSDGRSLWSGESPAPALALPESVELQRGGEYRALLSVRPADLLPPGGASVMFRSDSFGRMVLHRLRWAPVTLQVTMAAAFALACVALMGTRREGA